MSAARALMAASVHTRRQLQVAAPLWVRSQSTAASSASASASAAAAGCPHAAGRAKDHSTVAGVADAAAAAGCPVHSAGDETGGGGAGQPQLVEVPSLPFVGSLLTRYSGIPPMNEPYAFWPEMRRRYGDFYSFGLPGLGDPSDRRSTLYVIQSPEEMKKVVRSEGSYPSGMAQGAWAVGMWQKEAGMESITERDGDPGGFYGDRDNWKRIRNFMQTDLLHPSAARGYMSGIIEAAELASRGAPASRLELNDYFSRCAFDMFGTVMFGDLMGVADPETPSDPEDARFVMAAKTGLSTSTNMGRQLREAILVKQMGIKTAMYQKMKENLDVAWEIGSNKIDRFMERRERGELSDREKDSYLYRAVARQEEGGSGVSLQEAKELCWGGIFAAVDTTSGKMGWNVFQAALNEEAQERLRAELTTAVEAHGADGRLTVEALDRKNAPYLNAFVRETHRLTPVIPVGVRKRVGTDDMTIHGRPLPRGSAVVLDFSIQRDPRFVDDPESFQPERWLQDAVDARKGTAKEIIDHPFYKDPFSQGPRKCPGSRVALNEVAVLLAQLVLDWKITAPTVKSWEEAGATQETVLEPKLPQLDFSPRP